MKLHSATPHKKARIEIIPLIDIMFFLLASFMLVSMSMIKLQAIQTNLPAANTGSKVDKPDFIAIGIDKNGNYYFQKEKQAFSIDDLIPKLQPFYREKKDDLKVFINADQDTTYNSVVLALDKLRLMNIKKVSFPVKQNNKFDPAAAPKPAGAAAPPATPTGAVPPLPPLPAVPPAAPPAPPANP